MLTVTNNGMKARRTRCAGAAAPDDEELHSKVEAFKASTSGMQSLTARMDTLEAKIE